MVHSTKQARSLIVKIISELPKEVAARFGRDVRAKYSEIILDDNRTDFKLTDKDVEEIVLRGNYKTK